MEPVDVLLVSAPSTSTLKGQINRGVGVVPSGLASIGAILLENGYRVHGTDLFNDPKPSAAGFREIIATLAPRVVGISAATENFSNAVRLARICKQSSQQVTIVVGGPHVSFLAEQVLEDPAFDVVVRGEGEFTMLELVNFFIRGIGEIKGIRGITYREGDNIRRNGARALIQHLDELPLVARQLFDQVYSVPGALATSRGCPGRCIFCSAAALSGGKYRTRSAESVVDEIHFLRWRGIDGKLKFLDDTITADGRRLGHMLELMERTGLKTKWGAESRVDVVTQASLERMARCGCVSIQFGVESGSQLVLDRIRKRIQLEQVVRAVEWASHCIEFVSCSFIIGHPFDTEETVGETVALGLRLQQDYQVDVLFSIATPFPGTYLYNHADELGLRNLSKSFDDYTFLNPVFDSRGFNRQRLRNLQFEVTQRVILGMPAKVREIRRLQLGLLGDAQKSPTG